MFGTLKKIVLFAGNRAGLLKKSLAFAMLGSIFAALQFAALYVAVITLAGDFNVTKGVLLVTALMLVSIAGRIVTSIFSMNEQTEVGYGMVSDHRITIGDRLRYIPMGYFNKNNLGTITGVVTNTMTDIENYAPMVLVSLIGGLLNALGLTLFLFLFEPVLGLTAFLGMGLFLLVTEAATRKSTKTGRLRQKVQRGLVEAILEYVRGMSVIKAFGSEEQSENGVRKAISESNRGNLSLVLSVAPFMGLQEFIVRFFNVLLFLLTLYLYTTGGLSFAFSVLFVIVSFFVFDSLLTAGSQVTILQMLAASIDMAEEVLDCETLKEGERGKVAANAEIAFHDVVFSYGDRKILDHVSVTIPEHATTAIVGPSGAGKTTMCHLIARFFDVEEGSITLGGEDIRSFAMDDLMKNMSMVFQNVYLFEDTVFNNIAFGKPDASGKEVVEAAKKACCHDFIMSLPDGYDTRIGEGGSSLSGGEKQRISIARAILKDAPVIILDEATSSVDPENEEKLQKAIEGLTRDKTIIMIAHRLKTVKHADQILVLNKGQIEERGTHEELSRKPGLYRDFLNARSEALGWKLGTETKVCKEYVKSVTK